MLNANKNNQHIIAIGASAGGMEEIHLFFDHTPIDKVSYVIVQHLSPDFKSRMAELLAKHSKLKICDAVHNMIVEKNQVYLIPANKFMTIKDGKLQLTDKETVGGGPHMTIDTFFKSLANDQGNKAIGIILSGTGTDGGKGIEAIKKAGGMIIVQDPVSAKFSGMPSHAISTGFSDAVMAPTEMPKAIENYIKQLPWKSETEPEQDDSEETVLPAIIGLIKEHLPRDFSQYKRPTLQRRIKRRMIYNNFARAEHYLSFLKNNPSELESLAKDLLISVTSFFRDAKPYEVMERVIIPDIIERNLTEGLLKIWVAGCATGEEAYSIAILVKDYLDKINKQVDVKIFATDIDKDALDFASRGIYKRKISKDIPGERLDRYFTREGDFYKVKRGIRKMLIFAQHDLVKNPPYCNIDLTSCRNLLIYMDPVLQKKVLSMLHFGLKKGGYLFLGSSENANMLAPHFKEIDKKWKIYQNKEASHAFRFDTFSLPASTDEMKNIGRPFTRPFSAAYKKITLVEEVNEAVMKEWNYAGVCIDERLTVVQFFGDLNRYVLQKPFNLNLLELLPEPLAVASEVAISRVVKLNKKVAIRRIKIENKGATYVNLVVKPFNSANSSQKLILLLFSEDKSGQKSDAQEVFDRDLHTRQYIEGLEEELKETKENLQAALDNLEASNENLQSFNEELLSANEEMQSGNEELESVNEELQTINSELHVKIKEVTELNDELNNYFRSNVNGQLIVDNDLVLMKYSPAAVEHINLMEGDIGRPLDNITTNIKFETIIEDIKKVIGQGEVITKEVQSTTGKWFQLMAMPYIRQADNKVDGVILTFNNITGLKRAREELDQSNESLMRINADLDNFVYSASHDLTAPIANIESMVNLFKKKFNEDDPEIKKIAHMLDLSFKKFRNVIKDLADIGEIEGERHKVSMLNLEEMIKDIRLSMLDEIIVTNTKIHWDLQVEEVRFSKKNLRSVLYNLIHNSIKYKDPERDPEIMIRSADEPGFVVLSFTDNGMGMASDKAVHIFNLYKRLGQQADGHGIGLYLVKKIVDAAGGKVEVESELGEGTTFKIFLKA